MNVGNPFSAIPEELRILPNWCLWRLEYDRGPDEKPSKIPYQPNGYKANSVDPTTWATFEVAFNALQMGGFGGLGFMFGNTPYSGIDLDDASFLPKDKVTGKIELNPDYQNDLNRQIRIAHEFDSYSEVSPSGKGLHIIVRGKVPNGKRRSFIELYPDGRFFTMTGNVHSNKPIKDCEEILMPLWIELGGNPNPTAASTVNEPETQSDEEILNLARKHNAATFITLELGQWVGSYPSQSEADQAYLNIISYYTNSRAQVERIFRNSKLMRDKVNKNKPYLPNSISKAFDQKIPPIILEGMQEAFEKHKKKVKPVLVEPEFTITLPPGLMGEIASFIFASSPRPVPEVSLAAAIGLMAGICGRAYNISGTGLNQYILLLAMTGAGKEAMAEGIDKLMSDIKMQVPTSTSFIGPAEISSGAALFKYLGNTSQSFVSLLGEFGLRIKQLSAVNANGAEVSLRRMILDLYNKSGYNRVLAASAYSKKEDSTNSVPSPSFSILGESTPERFYEVLNEDMISEGLLPRFLLIEYKGGRVANNENRASIKPQRELLERLAQLTAQCEGINHSQPRRVIDVRADEAASKFLYDFDKEADAKINSADKDVIRQLWNRAHIKVLKLAALIAVGEHMYDPVININTVIWAANLVRNDIATLTKRFEDGEIGGNTFELNQHKDITRIIKEYCTKDFSYVSKYNALEKMHKDRVLTNNYLTLRLSRMASFRNDRMGATLALSRAVKNLIDNGYLSLINSVEMSAKYHTNMKSYKIHPSILEDQ